MKVFSDTIFTSKNYGYIVPIEKKIIIDRENSHKEALKLASTLTNNPSKIHEYNPEDTKKKTITR